jgi:hypothetical protein
MMVKGNHFHFDLKKASLIFKKRFTVLKIVNHFFEFKPFIITRLWESATAG